MSYSVQWIPPGRPGTVATLEVMRRLAIQGSRSPEIQELAFSLQNPGSLNAFLRSYWRSVPDPYDAELVRSPERQLGILRRCGHVCGDCDDAATFAASILVALDWPCRLIAIRTLQDFEFSHVFVRCLNEAGYTLDIDPIVPASSLPISGIAEVYELPL